MDPRAGPTGSGAAAAAASCGGLPPPEGGTADSQAAWPGRRGAASSSAAPYAHHHQRQSWDPGSSSSGTTTTTSSSWPLVRVLVATAVFSPLSLTLRVLKHAAAVHNVLGQRAPLLLPSYPLPVLPARVALAPLGAAGARGWAAAVAGASLPAARAALHIARHFPHYHVARSVVTCCTASAERGAGQGQMGWGDDGGWTGCSGLVLVVAAAAGDCYGNTVA